MVLILNNIYILKVHSMKGVIPSSFSYILPEYFITKSAKEEQHKSMQEKKLVEFQNFNFKINKIKFSYVI